MFPFSRRILSAERIELVFAKHGCLFGVHGIYSAAIMVWSFLSQVLRDGKEASCQAAVARVVSHCEQVGLAAPTSDTGDYCRARAKLSEPAIHELSCAIAADMEEAADETSVVSCSDKVFGHFGTLGGLDCPERLARTKAGVREGPSAKLTN